MKNNACFAMGLHFHQPVGNFKEILERAYQNCYKPFLETLTNYPDIKMTLHFSGNLLDYFEDKHPEFLEKIKDLIRRDQVEIMGGGYYEPIFQAIPQRDRFGQIEMLSRYSEKRFGVRPNGLWVPERVWSPELIKDFQFCGMKYAILDDAHIIKAGVDKDDLYGYFMAKDFASRIAIFPSDKALRYTMPFRRPYETIDYFKSITMKKKIPLFTYGDDAEKFGEWPYTYDWVYKKGWLSNFFRELTRNKHWLETVRFSDYLERYPPLKEVELPEASYEEMMEWSGGSWNNYLERYPESNQMHKRMLYVSERIKDCIDKKPIAADSERLREARTELYKGQTNCSYWHGVFGGIYLYHLRSAVYEHLIKADRIIDDIGFSLKNGEAFIRNMDFYKRGKDAVIGENKNFFICVDPENGGIIRELDHKKTSSGLINTLARREEFYHKKIIDKLKKEARGPLAFHEKIKIMDKRIKKDIFYDKYKRACLVDHFIDKDLKIEDFENCNYADMGGFAEGHFNSSIKDQRILLSRKGKVGNATIEVTKEIDLSLDDKIKVVYVLKNKEASPVDICFGTELNISMPYADSERYSYETGSKQLGGLHKKGTLLHSKHFLIKDSDNGLSVETVFSEEPQKIWYFPIMTVSQSERAYDLSYQSSCIFPMWNIRLKSSDAAKLTLFLGCI
ncbi:alpha-amylase/4-alpha-glucanotransferase domain-containing protein [Candidatus Omnitrophota bacterium]